MANKIPSRGDFSLNFLVFDTHEWMTDYLIDGPTGQNVLVVYPPKPTQCDNCKLDPATGRSSNIYNGTGPISFTDFTLCPRCGGNGRGQIETSDTIRLRVYWNPTDWIKPAPRFASGETGVMTIGYMVDLPKVEQGAYLLLNKDIQGMRRWKCERVGEAAPWGLKQNRYFVQFMKRVGGG